MCNPTVLVVKPDDVTDVMWLVDNPEQIEIFVPGRTAIEQNAQDRLDLIKHSLARHGKIFASFYRPGAFWEEEVFVCPKCKHATQIECAEIFPDETTASVAEWYCKYCYTAWNCSASRGMFRCGIDSDD